MKTPLVIEFFFDLICPWCLIGKRHLSTAIAQLNKLNPDVEVEMIWRSHMLLPDVPAQGLPYLQFYVQRLGSHEAVAARRVQVQRAGRLAGIDFAFGEITVMPSTHAAHRLIHFVGKHGSAQQQEALIERLLQGYFVDAEDIGDHALLTRLGIKYGFDGAAVADCLGTPISEGASEPDAQSSPRRSVGSVPSFVFNQQFTLSGALPPETLLAAMQHALSYPALNSM